MEKMGGGNREEDGHVPCYLVHMSLFTVRHVCLQSCLYKRTAHHQELSVTQ